jgi:hypothetical protein
LALFFIAIGAATVLLHWFVSWVEDQGLLLEAVFGLRAVEYFVFVGDGLTYLWFFLRVAWKFAREIKEQTK